MRRFSFIFLLSLFFHGCNKKDVKIPSVSTGPMYEVSITRATAVGYLLNDGGSNEITCGFCWDTLINPTTEDRLVEEPVNPIGAFASQISDLKADTKYFLRAYCANEAGTGYGNEISFTTKAAEVPWVHTKEITEITKNSAVCEGLLQYDGGETVISKGFCCSLNPDPTISDLTATVSTNIFSAKLTGLISNSTYYVRAYATNSVGTGYGLSVSFKTKAFFNFSIQATEITINSAKYSVNLSSDGEKPIFDWGIFLSARSTPDVNDLKIAASSGTNSLIAEFTGLSAATKYYIRPYVLTSTGTEYGEIYHFTTIGSGETVTDIDGNIYNTVRIGTQTWMAENLRVTRYNNGSAVNEIWAYNNDNANVAAYGRLYTYNTAQNNSICPTGWHVPTNAEWAVLGSYLIMNGHNYDGSIPSSDPFSGPASYKNNKLGKSLTSSTDWNTSDITGSSGGLDFPEKRNSSGFNAKPAGMYFVDGVFTGKFYFLGSMGIWWSRDWLKYVCGLGMHGVPIECFMSSWYITYDKVLLEAGTPYFGTQTAYSIRCTKD